MTEKHLHISSLVKGVQVNPIRQEVLEALGDEWKQLTEDLIALQHKKEEVVLLKELLEEDTNVTSFSYGDLSEEIISYSINNNTLRIYKEGIHIISSDDKPIRVDIFSNLNLLIGGKSKHDIQEHLCNLLK